MQSVWIAFCRHVTSVRFSAHMFSFMCFREEGAAWKGREGPGGGGGGGGLSGSPLDPAGTNSVAQSQCTCSQEALFVQVALKTADIAHLSSPIEVHRRWTALLTEEFFRQGDSEPFTTSSMASSAPVSAGSRFITMHIASTMEYSLMGQGSQLLDQNLRAAVIA